MKGGYGSSQMSSSRPGSSTSGTGSTGSSATGKPGMSAKNSKYLNIGLAILGVIILLFLIGSYYNHKKNNGDENNRETFYSHHGGHKQNPISGTFTPGIESQRNTDGSVQPSQGLGKNEVFSSVPSSENYSEHEPEHEQESQSRHNRHKHSKYTSEETSHHQKHTQRDGLHGNQYPSDCYPKDTLTAAELLPSDANSKWAQVNPCGQGELGDQNFLEAGFHIGTNTIGQTLRNPNLQLRSEPSNPQVKVSPWMQTTIEPDSNRRGLEIGGC